jgi:group I intron endonuclease
VARWLDAMKRYGSIYVVTNTVTGEQYVGQTRQLALCRWKCHVNTARSKVAKKYRLAQAIATYGVETFLFAEVFTAFDADTLNNAEMQIIAELEPAYNIAKGGAGHRGVVPSAEVRKNRSDRLKRQWANPEWRQQQLEKIKEASSSLAARERGKRIAPIGNAARWAAHAKTQPVAKDRSAALRSSWKNPEIRQRRINGLKKALSDPNTLARYRAASIGRRHADSTKEAIARAKWKPVYCRELQCSFLSQKAAAEFLGVLKTSVSNAVRKKGRVAGKYTLEKVA